MQPRTLYILSGLAALTAAAAYSQRRQGGGYDPFPDDASFGADLSQRQQVTRAARGVERFRTAHPERQAPGPYGWQNHEGGCGCGG